MDRDSEVIAATRGSEEANDKKELKPAVEKPKEKLDEAKPRRNGNGQRLLQQEQRHLSGPGTD